MSAPSVEIPSVEGFFIQKQIHRSPLILDINKYQLRPSPATDFPEVRLIWKQSLTGFFSFLNKKRAPYRGSCFSARDSVSGLVPRFSLLLCRCPVFPSPSAVNGYQVASSRTRAEYF